MTEKRTEPASDTATRWWRDGERVVGGLVERLTDDELAGGSALPGWSRAHVVAHLARNADALVNLLEWARTGVDTPMYPSRAVRDADIEATAARPAAELRADYVDACGRLARAIETTPVEAWRAEVRNGQGVTVPASLVPWMRGKEVWVHGTDLDAGLSFADLPAEFCAALVDDVLGLFAARDQQLDVTVVATDVDRTWGAAPCGSTARCAPSPPG
ncbi:maleylpyruvate isomerase N-terminal domain-containing protein [Blastococcus brunescens]|uniref:Maleylpyruvate isomerase family mycothiol-dependent enzyme n=1 Tax=Blastococcus brunescens TaxID=1564165 RepID=A0ABZ1AZC6_9ACTN|nr:maleylpyruvate isomerase family mycothiol-dependent enzyme [Blastococcus sp. BMG 8361]WRL62155.1 maleylpyruvate isomerase family mycothiol-dependent enzyme [Blastococcus sp. BMG 8361]